MKILSLNNPHTPFLIRLPVFIALSSCFLLIVLKPFSIENANHNFLFYGLLGGYGILNVIVLCGIIIVVDGWVSFILMSKRNKIILLCSLIFLSCVINYGYANFLHAFMDGYKGLQFQAKPFLEMAWKTMMVAFIPLTSFSWYEFRKGVHSDARINSSKVALDDPITIEGVQENDWIRLPAHNIYFIKNEDNYVAVHYKNEEGKLKSKLLRSSMSRIEEMLEPDQFVRCHQSYIINLSNISEAIRKEGKLYLTFVGLSTEIPVSRRRKKFLEKHLTEIIS